MYWDFFYNYWNFMKNIIKIIVIFEIATSFFPIYPMEESEVYWVKDSQLECLIRPKKQQVGQSRRVDNVFSRRAFPGDTLQPVDDAESEVFADDLYADRGFDSILSALIMLKESDEKKNKAMLEKIQNSVRLC